MGGAGVSKANGVPPAIGGLTARSLGYKTKREGDYRSLDFLVTLFSFRPRFCPVFVDEIGLQVLQPGAIDDISWGDKEHFGIVRNYSHIIPLLILV